jgi:hypothetical protein
METVVEAGLRKGGLRNGRCSLKKKRDTLQSEMTQRGVRGTSGSETRKNKSTSKREAV